MSKIIEIKYKSWREISIQKFDEIKSVLTDKNIADEIDKQLQLIAIMSEETVDAISNIPLHELSRLVTEIEFINKPPKTHGAATKYYVNGRYFSVMMNLREITAGQYIDFQTLYKDSEKNLKYLLALFLIPKGCKYGDGKYDISEIADYIYNNLSIEDARNIMFFFVLLLESLTVGTLTSSIMIAKKQMKKLKTKKEKMKLGRAIIRMKELVDLVKDGDGLH